MSDRELAAGLLGKDLVRRTAFIGTRLVATEADRLTALEHAYATQPSNRLRVSWVGVDRFHMQ